MLYVIDLEKHYLLVREIHDSSLAYLSQVVMKTMPVITSFGGKGTSTPSQCTLGGLRCVHAGHEAMLYLTKHVLSSASGYLCYCGDI